MQISLFSQCLSIELSITWEMGYDIFKKDSIVEIPKLNITYRNNCDTDYYFFKVSDNSDNLPFIKYVSAMTHPETPVTYREEAEKYLKYTRQNFNVRIEKTPLFLGGWSIFYDSEDLKNTLSSALVCRSLLNIYKYLFHENNNGHYGIPEGNVDLLLDILSDLSNLTSEKILGASKSLFVFLKSGETFVDTYNLIGFKLVEGCFTFLIDKDVIENYVIDFNNEKIELPQLVGEYQLYSGGFNTNEVTVCFGER